MILNLTDITLFCMLLSVPDWNGTFHCIALPSSKTGWKLHVDFFSFFFFNICIYGFFATLTPLSMNQIAFYTIRNFVLWILSASSCISVELVKNVRMRLTCQNIARIPKLCLTLKMSMLANIVYYTGKLLITTTKNH